MIKMEGAEVYFARRGGKDNGVWIDDIDISKVTEQISAEALAQSLRSVVQIGANLKEAATDFKSVTVEFGVDVAIGGKLVVVEGDVGAQLKVRITW